jgi:hypothetical protein
MFGISYEKKKAATKLETLSPEQSQQAEREARATTWVQTVGGMTRGRLYGIGDMSSHFHVGELKDSTRHKFLRLHHHLVVNRHLQLQIRSSG